MNIRIEGVVHLPHPSRYVTTMTLCGTSFGPGVISVEISWGGKSMAWGTLDGSSGVVTGVPPDGEETVNEVTCLLCLAETS